MKKKPSCFITNECAQKLKYYVGATKMEISGIGKSEIRDGDIYITDIKIYKQKCTGASTDLDEEDMARVQYQMDRDGEDLKDWNVWWHSHAAMSVFWSGTDNATVNSHANNGGFLISLVTNHKGDFKTRIDIFPKDVSPFNTVTYLKIHDNVPTSILPVNHNPERAKVLDDQLTAGYKLVDDKIKEIEDGATLAISTYDAELKESLAKYTVDINEEKARLIRDLEDGFENDNRELIDEYNSMSSTVPENTELKEAIEKEVAEKISTIVFTPKNNTLWFNKTDKRDGYHYDYDDIDYSRCKPPITTNDDCPPDDYPDYDDFDKKITGISKKCDDEIDREIGLPYPKAKSKKQMKREIKAQEKREIGFSKLKNFDKGVEKIMKI